MTIKRGALLLLLATAVYVGGWAYFAPAGWYANFPGAGLRWLPQLGPYNAHLAKDVGAFYLTLGVLTALAVRRSASPELVRATAAAWLTFNLLHLGYHATMLDMYAPSDRALNVVALGVVVLVAAVPLWPARKVGPGVAGPSR